MITRIKSAFVESMSAVSWIDDTTKKIALEKVIFNRNLVNSRTQF